MKIISGKITWTGTVAQGVSQRSGNAWQSQEIAIQFGNPEYPELIVVKAFTSPNIGKYAAGQGISCDVYFHAHEYNGRMYNEVNMKNDQLSAVGGAMAPQQQTFQQPVQQNLQMQQPQQKQQPQQAAPTNGDDLPF